MLKSLFAASIGIVALVANGAQAVEVSADERVVALKSEILAIATANQEDLTNLAEVRAQLEPLVAELASLQQLTPEASLERKVGTWQQIWTDDADDLKSNNLFVSVDRKQTYQVVLEGGLFYNVSVIKLPLGLRFSAFLEGAYAPQGDVLGLEFQSLSLRLGGLGEVTQSVQKATEGRLFGLVPFPGGARRPNGPVGVKGEIKSVYIDQDLRVDYGQNLDDGVQDLFILVRSDR